MKKIICIFLSITLIMCTASCTVFEKELTLEEQLDQVISSMTLEEKVGQLFIFSIPGTELTEQTKSFLNETKAGNIILYGDNISDRQQTFDLNKSLQQEIIANTQAPAFIGIDQEGGGVTRVTDGATEFTSAMGIAATGNAANAETVGNYMGEELRNLGFNINFAPDVDMNTNPANPIIGTRSYGDNYETVVSFSEGMIKGIQAQQVLACVKHYPGHGAANADTHTGLVTVDKTIDELRQSDLIPFEWAIKNGTDGIMTAHISYPNVHDTTEPATMSEYFLKDLLRDEYGFQGLVITDSVSMGAITENYSMSEAAVTALNSGADMVVMGGAGTNEQTLSSQLEAYNAVLEGIKNGSVSHADIYDKVYRVLFYKHRYGLFEYVKDSYEWMVAPPTYKEAEHEDFADNVAAESITLVKDAGGLLPIDNFENTLILSDSAPLSVDGGPSAAEYLADLTGAGWTSYDLESSDFNAEEIIQQARSAQRLVILSRSAFFNQEDASFINRLTASNSNAIVISIGSPYDIRTINCNTYLCAYSGVPSTIRAVASVLKGEREITGVLPVNLDAEITVPAESENTDTTAE